MVCVSSPTISVVMAAANATASLPAALEAVAEQDYSGEIEVVVAAADQPTAEIARRMGVIVVDNPSGATPSGLNRAIARSSGDVVIRVDAHSRVPPGYVTRCVEVLERTEADVVGGMQVPVGETFWERAIAAAMVSRFGAGDARYRLGGEEGPVETVYLGAFRRDALERIGGFDEEFRRTQDYELNHRIIASGGVVWFDPDIRVDYRPRGSLGALARQYFDYGTAKRQFNRKHPGSLRWRQLGPPALVATLVGSMLFSLIWPPMLIVPLAYLVAAIVAGLLAAPTEGLPSVGVPFALVTMHLAWGLGFLSG